MKKHERREKSEDAEPTDWQAVISEDQEIIEVKRMGIDMCNTRLRPVYTPIGDLTIVVPAVSEEAARKKALHIAQRIASAGLWGLDLLNLSDPELFS